MQNRATGFRLADAVACAAALGNATQPGRAMRELVHAMSDRVHATGHLVHALDDRVHAMGRLVHAMTDLVHAIARLVHAMGHRVHAMSDFRPGACVFLA